MRKIFGIASKETNRGKIAHCFLIFLGHKPSDGYLLFHNRVGVASFGIIWLAVRASNTHAIRHRSLKTL